MVFFLCHAASSRTKVPLSSATKMLYTKEDLLKLSGQQQQPQPQQQQQSDKTELDLLFEELPSVPRYVDKDSIAVRSTMADMQRIRPSTSTSTSTTTTFDQPISVTALSEQMRRLRIPKPSTATTKTSEENKAATSSSVYISQSASQARYVPRVAAFKPSAPPKSPSSERSTQYSHIPTGTARFENVRPPGSSGTPRPKLPDEYCRQPPFYSAPQPKPQKPFYIEPEPEPFFSAPRPKPAQPTPEPKKTKNCIIS